MFNHKLPPDFPMQTLRKKTSPCKYKNEPGRFLGDGVSFRAKLIGVLEVGEARGDRMCQEALGDLKMAVRAAGEHKQRIQVHVAIDGLRLRDDKTGDSLYHHPVHKISFIAQDMSDSRAFGYIFGSPDTGHRFFGIKTDKAASQVVIAMRDLFQVVFELKKKEIELAKLQLEGKSSVNNARLNICLDTTKTKSLINPSGEVGVSHMKLLTDPTSKLSESAGASSCSGGAGAKGGGAVAELVDLEQELSSLRRGLHQMEGLTPPSGAPVSGGTDPFGDSFTSPPSLTKGLLPPPPSGVSRDGRSRSCTSTTPSVSSQPNTSYSPAKSSGILSSAAVAFNPPPSQHYTLEQANETAAQKSSNEPTFEQTTSAQQSSLAFDVFMELDPLGTGRSKPYIDKKHFFQELKNPPKKVLKDLVPGAPSLLDVSPNMSSCIDSALNEPLFGTSHITSLRRQSSGRNPLMPSNFVQSPQTLSNTQNIELFDSDPFAETDPFDTADPFSESLQEDPFLNSPGLGSFRDTDSAEFSLAKEGTLDMKNGGEYSSYQKKDENGRVFVFSHKLDGRKPRVGAVFNGPLQVSLPPEQQSPKSPLLTRQTSPHRKHSTLYKQRSLLGKPSTYTQHIPSPPPPLPPKPSTTPLEGICLKPPPRPPHSDTEPADSASEAGPPLPNPARRWGTQAQATLRINKPNLSSITTNSSEDEYLTPIPPSAVKKSTAPGLDITITQLLTCGLEDLALKMNVPASQLSSMTLAQLTEYLTDFLETSQNDTTEVPAPPQTVAPKVQKYGSYSNNTLGSADFRPNFEENFSFRNTTTTSDTFVANFDDFNKKLDPSFDRYAVFREIRDEELRVIAPDSPDEVEEPVNNGAEYHSLDFEIKVNNLIPEIDDLTVDEKLRNSHSITPIVEGLKVTENPAPSRSPIRDLKLEDTFNAFQNSMQKVSPCKTKLDDLKAVINKLQKSEQSSKSPVTIGNNEEHNSDRYAALREITIIESSPTEFDLPAVPPEGPKERKRSDEKSDGFDNSDFFDCIDNNSLSLSHAEDAFRKSPMLSKSPLPKPTLKQEQRTLPPQSPANLMPQLQTPAPNSAGSMSDIVSGSSPETAHKEKAVSRHAGSNDSSGGGDAPAWGDFPKRRSPRSDESPWSSDSKDSREGGRRNRGSRRASGGDPPPALPRPRRRPPTKSWNTRQTSSSSRDMSPWEEEPPPPPRSHTRSVTHNRERHGSSREHIDSGSNREREKEKRDRRDSGSVSGRDRELSRERDHGREWEEQRGDRRRSRERDREWDGDIRDRDREYSRESSLYREPKVRERGSRDKDLHSRDREKDRGHRRQRHHSWVDDEEYSEERSMMGASGEVSRSASREFRDRWEAWPETEERMWPARRDDRGYNTVGWRGEARRRAEASRQSENPNSRYSNTVRGRWSSGSRSSRDRESDPRSRYSRPSRSSRSPHRESPPRSRRHHRDTRRHQSPEGPTKTRARQRFSNDFSTERESPRSPFENDFVETPCSSSSKKYKEESSSHDRERESPRVSERGFSSERFRIKEERPEAVRSPSPVCGGRYEGGRVHALLENEDSPTPQTNRFRFDSDSVSPRSLFEDDFATELRNGTQPSTAPASRSTEPNLPCSEVIAEEDESGTKSRASSDKNVGFEVSSRPRSSGPMKSQNRIKPRSRPDPDIKKSESVNIFVRDKDPFDGDDFFCTGSDKAGRRENWPGDFPAFDDV